MFANPVAPRAGLCGASQKPDGEDCGMGKKATGTQAVNRVVLLGNTLVCCSENTLISAGGLLARCERSPGTQLTANGQG